MVQGMNILSFTRNSFFLIGTRHFFFVNKNHKLKNLLTNVKKVLMLFSLGFFNIEYSAFHYLVIISKL